MNDFDKSKEELVAEVQQLRLKLSQTQKELQRYKVKVNHLDRVLSIVSKTDKYRQYEVVHDMTEDGRTLREIADVLGVSTQTVDRVRKQIADATGLTVKELKALGKPTKEIKDIRSMINGNQVLPLDEFEPPFMENARYFHTVLLNQYGDLMCRSDKPYWKQQYEYLVNCGGNRNIRVEDLDRGDGRGACEALFCPACTPYIVEYRGAVLKAIMDRLGERCQNCIHLVVTVSDVRLSDIKTALERLNYAKEHVHSAKKCQNAVVGYFEWVRVYKEKNGHFAVQYQCFYTMRRSYYNGRTFITREEWSTLWREAFQEATCLDGKWVGTGFLRVYARRAKVPKDKTLGEAVAYQYVTTGMPFDWNTVLTADKKRKGKVDDAELQSYVTQVHELGDICDFVKFGGILKHCYVLLFATGDCVLED